MEHLHMHIVRDIIYRLRAGESERRIALDLGLSRGAVRKYHALVKSEGYLRPAAPMPDEAALSELLGRLPQPPRQTSSLEPFDEVVRDLLAQGCEMAAILARLREDHGYTGSYSSVSRYVHRICPPEPRVTVRVPRTPGEEAQVDFGSVGMLFDPRAQRLRRAYAFVATLGYSRHQYAELVFDQRVPTWVALHRRAFESWGGVPKRLVPDNLKPAVSQALLYDSVLAEAYRRMAQHYGFLISPTRPGTPQHKGIAESGVHYLQRNFMAGQHFVDIDAANHRLPIWVRETAGTRLHGTTHQPPLKLFAEYEQPALLPLPAEPFALLEVRLVKVHPDCHVTIAGSYYSAPYVYVGRSLEAYIHERVVQLFQGVTLVATHVRAQNKGEHHTLNSHYPEALSAYLEHTPTHCRHLATQVGPATVQVVEQLLSDRPLDQLRQVQAIVKLAKTHPPERLEAACARALYYGDGRYRRIKEILNAALDREPLPDAEPAPVSRAHAFARDSVEFFGQVIGCEEEGRC